MSDSELCLSARSVSRSLHGWLRAAPMDGSILSVSRRAWLAGFDGDRLVSIVEPDVGDGPLNIVLRHTLREWPDVQPGVPVHVQGHRLRCGRLDVSLEGASVWEPCPDWERLRASARAMLNRLGYVHRGLEEHVPEGTMMLVVEDQGQARVSCMSAGHVRARSAAEALWAGWRGDNAQLGAGAAQLAGLGVGLTPSGDDFLLGAMLCAWLAHPEPSGYCATVADSSASRTTLLSAAFLRAAAQGECSAAWHRLLEALEVGPDDELIAAARAVLAYGHTSGADALSGFLWMGLRVVCA